MAKKRNVETITDKFNLGLRNLYRNASDNCIIIIPANTTRRSHNSVPTLLCFVYNTN